MAQVLKVVRNAERAVQRNKQVIKRLELRITRTLQDAIGRSHTTTSSISLDSLCTQDEIERLLTDSGSALSLTLSDVSDDAASIMFIPDTLSGVDISSARIKFPTVEEENSSKEDPETQHATEEIRLDQPATVFGNPEGGLLKMESGNRVRIDSYFDLAETLAPGLEPQSDSEVKEHKHTRESSKLGGAPISAAEFQNKENSSTAQKIIDAIKTNRLAKTVIRKGKHPIMGSFGFSAGDFVSQLPLLSILASTDML
jgi:hypothetical protein